MIFFAQQRDNPQPYCTIKLLKPPAPGSLPTCWPALLLDLPQDLLFWRPFWQRVMDNGNNWWLFSSVPSYIIWSRIVRSNTAILLRMSNETLHNRCAGSSLTWVDFLAWETLDQHRFSQMWRDCKGMFFSLHNTECYHYCGFEGVWCLAASRICLGLRISWQGSWVWIFLGGSSDNLDSLFIINIISPGLLPCHKLLLTWTAQRTGLKILNLFINSSAVSKTHFRPFPIWSVRAKYGYKPPTSAWVWMLWNAPKYQFCS